MKKLTLSVDALCIESFNTSPTTRQHRDTVRAHRFSDHVEDYTCGWMQSCAFVCESDGCPTHIVETCAAC